MTWAETNRFVPRRGRAWRALLAALAIALAPLAARADEGVMQRAGQKLDQWGNDAAEAVGKAAGKTGAALDKAARKTGNKLDEWGNKIQEKLAPGKASGNGGN